MEKTLFLLFLAITGIVIADELSTECQYVNGVWNLTNVSNVKKCFETYTVHDDVIKAIMRNLEIIHDFYPYTDIAQNPPSEPAGYFHAMNFTSGLKELNETLAASNKTVASVFRPIMSFINGFRDGHFSLNMLPTQTIYNNIFAPVYVFLPFQYEVVVDNNDRKIKIHTPNHYFLPEDDCKKINDTYAEGKYVTKIDDQDAFTFFVNFFGKYETMKSPQGSLVNTRKDTKGGVLTGKFSILRFPLDNAFDTHVITFSDDSEMSFTLCFENLMNMGQSTTRDTVSNIIKKSVPSDSMEGFEETLELLRNFKRRSVRAPHALVPCGNIANMNYIQIASFDVAQNQFINELVECVEDFDKNTDPIIIVLPENPGGNVALSFITQFFLMPRSDFRSIHAMRKSEYSRQIAVDKNYIAYGSFAMSSDDSCTPMSKLADLTAFWNKTETDHFGTVAHERTKKSLLALQVDSNDGALKNVRKPTDIIVVTDGYCFSACAFLVNGIIRAGGGIVVGYGPTMPGGDLFAAGQCPSSVIDPSPYFADLANNGMYGLMFQSTVTESFDITNTSDNIPGDYSILPIDVHSGYYGEYTPGNPQQTTDLLTRVIAVHQEFKTKCNPSNKRLILFSDNCTGNKPHATRYGYGCGSDGKWNSSTCRVAQCEEGYVVDFNKDECIPNTCDIRTPQSSSSSTTSKTSSATSTTSKTSSATSTTSKTSAASTKSTSVSSSATVYPIVSILIFAALILF